MGEKYLWDKDYVDPEHQRNMERIKKDFDEIISGSPERCRQFLIDAGICDENGNLTEPYRN